MILVFGSINVDLVVPVPRLPRPGETVLGGDYLLLPGGKGANQALAARRAGAVVVIAGAVGEDGFAATTLDPLRRAGIDTGLVRAVAAPTGCAAIMVSEGGENIIAVASGANLMARSDQVPDALLGPRIVLVAQMEVPSAETGAMIRRVRAAGGYVLLNLAPAGALDDSLLRDIDLVVANEQEAATLGADPARIATTLRHGLIVTRGAAGADAYLRNGATLSVPALPVAAIDTTGAGDTFVGVLAAALAQGQPIETGLRRASAAAGLACLARGAQAAMPDAAAIEEAMGRLPQR
ncbi:MAG TPA: ribokinase [Stellaceae bacterium]|nr:ribokinase [Stellaceae bacterium]